MVLLTVGLAVEFWVQKISINYVGDIAPLTTSIQCC